MATSYFAMKNFMPAEMQQDLNNVMDQKYGAHKDKKMSTGEILMLTLFCIFIVFYITVLVMSIYTNRKRSGLEIFGNLLIALITPEIWVGLHAIMAGQAGVGFFSTLPK